MEIILRQPLKEPVITQLFSNEFKWFNWETREYYDFYASYGLKGHPGVDYRCNIGTPVYSTHDGVCMYAGQDSVNGKMVQIWNEELGFKTLYGHNSEFKVKAGDRVKAGQLISLSGNTGEGTGPHLHFGFKYTGQGGNGINNNNGYNGASDPLPFIKLTYNGLEINHKNMTFKKVPSEPHIWMCDEENKNRMMVIDMATLFVLNGGKFEEVPTLVDYKITGSLVWTERVIN
jgi:murein DD-endopeptidase MepM/ murein hydrolase activator NlpD